MRSHRRLATRSPRPDGASAGGTIRPAIGSSIIPAPRISYTTRAGSDHARRVAMPGPPWVSAFVATSLTATWASATRSGGSPAPLACRATTRAQGTEARHVEHERLVDGVRLGQWAVVQVDHVGGTSIVARAAAAVALHDHRVGVLGVIHNGRQLRHVVRAQDRGVDAGEGDVDERLVLHARTDLVRRASGEDRFTDDPHPPRVVLVHECPEYPRDDPVRVATGVGHVDEAHVGDVGPERRAEFTESRLRNGDEHRLALREPLAHERQRCREVFVEIAVVQRLMYEHIGFRGREHVAPLCVAFPRAFRFRTREPTGTAACDKAVVVRSTAPLDGVQQPVHLVRPSCSGRRSPAPRRQFRASPTVWKYSAA